MQNHSTPDTPFAEVLRAAQAGEMEISWQKTAPVTESERNAARQLKRTFGYTLPVPVLLTAVVCYLVPHLFFDGGKLFLPTIIVFALYNIITPLSTLWLMKRYNRFLDLPTGVSQPATYYLRFKEIRNVPKGLSVHRSITVRLNYSKLTPHDWQTVLPQAEQNEVHRLSQIIIQRLNSQ